MTRPVFYELVEMAEMGSAPDGSSLIVHSHGVPFSLGSVEAEALEAAAIEGAAG